MPGELINTLINTALLEVFTIAEIGTIIGILLNTKGKDRVKIYAVCFVKMFIFNLLFTYLKFYQTENNYNGIIIFTLNVVSLMFYFASFKIISKKDYLHVFLSDFIAETVCGITIVIPYMEISYLFEGNVLGFGGKGSDIKRNAVFISLNIILAVVVWLTNKIMSKFAYKFADMKIKMKALWWGIVILVDGLGICSYAEKDLLYHRNVFIYIFTMIGAGIVFLYEVSLWVRKRQEKLIRQENQILIVENAVMKEYYETLQYQVERTRRFRHDIEKHMNVLKEMIAEKDNSEQIVNYASQVQDEYSYLRHIAYCENPVINAILVNKKQQCEEQGIEMKIDMPTFNMGNIKEIDMVAILSNLLDVVMSGNKIVFQCGERADNLVIQVSYSDSDEKAESEKELMKKLSLTKEIVEKYDGTINVTQDIGKVMATLVIYKG